jgi:hypothetical protein
MQVSSLRYFGTRIAALALGMCCLPIPILAQKQPSNADSRSAQEEDIREAAFLYLFNVGTGPDPDYSVYCLSVDSDGVKNLHDPSDALMKRFPPMHRTLRKFSECEIVKKPKDSLFGTIRDKQTGKTAWMVSLTSIEWVNDHEARIGGDRYCGGLCAWGTTLQATLQDGKWKVTIVPGASVWVS